MECVVNKTSLKELLPKEFPYISDPLPTHGIVSITNRCNLSCPYCFHSQSDYDMTLETMEHTIRYLLSNAAITNKKASVSFFGGEPLLRFYEIIYPIVTKYQDAVEWTMTTNGTLLTEQIIDFCKDNNIQILLSIDGCKNVQDIQRPMKSQESSFDKLKNIIPYLLLKLPNTTFRSTITKFSLPYLAENIKTAQKFGFKQITLIPNLFEEWGTEDYRLWERFIDDEAIHIMQCLAWEEPFGYLLTNLTNGVKELKYQEYNQILKLPIEGCGMGNYGIGISPDGSLHPCQEDNGLNIVNSIGDIYKGIDKELHLEYSKKIYDKWLEFIETIDELPGSTNFKLFYANSYCSNRLREGYAANNTQTYYLRALHRACSRLYAHYHHSLHPIANLIF